MTKREQIWLDNYRLLKAYIEEHHHLPNKKKVECRALLNWWKYNRKIAKAGKIDEEHLKMLEELSNLREGEKRSFFDEL